MTRRSATVVVIDGFGIGAMPDAGVLRGSDAHADTLGALTTWSRRERGRSLHLPWLSRLGLGALRPDLAGDLGVPAIAPGIEAVARRAALGYPGADSFAGHQTLMGADMSHVTLCLLVERIVAVEQALRADGHMVERLDGLPLLVVDGAALVHDNLEADPGLNWNVSCRLTDLPFEDIVAIARIVRSVAPVARVIAVGGHTDRPLAEAVREGSDGAIGMDTPASGLYQHDGLQVLHLGAEVDHGRQLHEVAARDGLDVTLVGKAADLLIGGPELRRLPAVETDRIMDAVAGVAGSGLVVANVQQTDLAGHSQDPLAYADLLEYVDERIGEIARAGGPDDLLVITADHGNDPSIGHPFHTREWVPVLAARGTAEPGRSTGRDLASLADIGAGVGRWLGLPDVLAVGTPTELLLSEENAR
ncbi:phosphopentomutase [Aeromicrobium sp. PE09-221]|uniref:phosphopentomutase n=1 Tax=Aeromicrobium sp. PE09-221 TaxID=1898043 RepID=UPI000B3ED5BC|nr:phosphopentomutase [Aeromicrobium sp. PE09-221]OUZ09041.1 phosphopentomutase [Aeromicrobium sp. PE09-221]